MKGMIKMPHYNAYNSFRTKKSIEKNKWLKKNLLGRKLKQ